MSPLSPASRLSLIFLCLVGLGLGHALKVPFRVKDLLPALPHQVSWPVLNNLHSAADLLPYFIGSVSPNNGSIEWKGACFYGNEARLELTQSNRNDPDLGGGVLYLKVPLFPSFSDDHRDNDHDRDRGYGFLAILRYLSLILNRIFNVKEIIFEFQLFI